MLNNESSQHIDPTHALQVSTASYQLEKQVLIALQRHIRKIVRSELNQTQTKLNAHTEGMVDHMTQRLEAQLIGIIECQLSTQHDQNRRQAMVTTLIDLFNLAL